MKPTDLFEDPAVSYGAIDDKGVFSLINTVREGIKFNLFMRFVNRSPFNITEWATFLHLSERTLQRYQRQKRTFDSLQSEKILEIALLYKKGVEVFGNAEQFHTWLETENLALGKIRPKTLLDSSFGLGLLKDELTRIEYGTLA